MSFLYGKKLQKEIKQCLSSKESKRCVVAFVGRDASKFIKGKCEILCDLFSSGTNPYEIKKLLSKKNVSIRHKKDLHAKIYLTDSFAILGSANMTNHALNFDDPENTLIEACSKFDKEILSKNYNAIKRYVDSLWEDGVDVTLQMVDEAIENYRLQKNDEIPSRLNMTDFCDKPLYICLYTDANLTEEGEKTAKQKLGTNWSCKDYSVWENWKNMPRGYFFDLYWHPRSKKN